MKFPVSASNQQLGSLRKRPRRGSLHDFGFLLLLSHAADPLQSLREPFFVDRLQQVVDRFQAEGLNRVLVIRRGQHEVRQREAHLTGFADDAQSIQSGHLNVQEGDVRLQVLDQAQGFQSVFARPDDLDV